MDNEKKIASWCYDCKEPIFDGDPFVLLDGKTYHPDCFRQMKNYFDPFLAGENE